MCLLFHKNNYARITKKDIKVYKILCYSINNNGIYSPFYRMNWILGVTYSVPELGIVKEEQSGYDGKDTREARRKWGMENTKYVKEGFHSALTKERLCTYPSCRLFECIIPAGSKYIKGATDLVVSDKLIIVKEAR